MIFIYILLYIAIGFIFTIVANTIDTILAYKHEKRSIDPNIWIILGLIWPLAIVLFISTCLYKLLELIALSLRHGVIFITRKIIKIFYKEGI